MPEAYDFHDALIQIEMLFQSHILSFGYKEYSLETFADRKYFAGWKGREGCIDTDAMRQGLNIDGILRAPEPSDNEVLTYLQYVLNIAELCRRSYNAEEMTGYDFDVRNYTELLSRVKEVLGRLGYELKYIADREFVYLIPKDPAAGTLMEISGDPENEALAEYRSFQLTGELDKKRALLAKIGERIEGFDDNLTDENVRLFRKIMFMLNHLKIRNEEPIGERAVDGVPEAILEMTDEERENWYDTTYQLMLLRILGHASADRLREVSDLAAECGIEGIDAIPSRSREEETPAALPEKEETSPEAEEEQEERKLQSERRQNTHMIRNVIIALIIADILFVLVVAFFLFVL